MALTYKPKVGEILECDYGDYRDPLLEPPFDGRLIPEIVKRRLVVVLNGKIHNACIVVPLSTTKDHGKIILGYHIEVAETEVIELAYFSPQLRWAKADLVQQVSHERLFKLRNAGRGYTDHSLSRERTEQIQKAVIKAISGTSLLAAGKDSN